ncbi:MAG: ankyrin repeat domain-containing protein [Gemmataceae bacterium]
MFALAFLIAAAPVPAEATAAEKYEAAVLASIHWFARQNEDEHLGALLEKHPKLVSEVERFRQPRKPYSTDAYTPLHWAAREGHARAAAVLINYKANMNADCGNGWTPLHLAALGGHLDVVKTLVENGANTDAKTMALPEREYYAPSQPPGLVQKPINLPASPARTALDIAIEAKKPAVADYLRSVRK